MVRVNEYGQPVGDDVDWAPGVRLEPVTLTGRTCRLEPLSEAHLDGLYDALCIDSPPQVWTYMPAGPFDDRLALGVLRLRDGVVTGRLTVTTDVSELLELEVVAGFYDTRGRFLGTARWVHHLDESGEHGHAGPPEESETFRVVAPARLRERVASAAVGVPVLVNE